MSDHKEHPAVTMADLAAAFRAGPSPTQAPMPGVSGVGTVLAEIAAERTRQDTKWGEQNHDMQRGPNNLALFAELAQRMRETNDDPAQRCWMTILLEEAYEAGAETDPARIRAELVQVAAVAVASIEAIDRREPTGAPATPDDGLHDAVEADNEQLRQRLDRVITHRDTLEAAITQVRAIKKSPGRSAFNLHANAQDDGWDQALDAVHVALDGLPTTDDAPPPASSAATPGYELREALLVLLSRATRGVLLPDEAALLRQHVETELRAGDKARKRGDIWKAKALEIETHRDQLAADVPRFLRFIAKVDQRAKDAEADRDRLARELATMTHVARVNGRAHRIAYQASVEAHAAVARMGQMASVWEQQLPLVIRTATVVDAVRTVTDGLLTPADALAEQRAGDLSEEHDVHRKQLAGAIDMTLDRNWEQLIAGAARLHSAASAAEATVARVHDFRAWLRRTYPALKTTVEQLDAALDGTLTDAPKESTS